MPLLSEIHPLPLAPLATNIALLGLCYFLDGEIIVVHRHSGELRALPFDFKVTQGYSLSLRLTVYARLNNFTLHDFCEVSISLTYFVFTRS